MEYPKFIVSNQKEESISIQRVKLNEVHIFSQPSDVNLLSLSIKTVCTLISWLNQKPADQDLHCFQEDIEF